MNGNNWVKKMVTVTLVIFAISVTLLVFVALVSV